MKTKISLKSSNVINEVLFHIRKIMFPLSIHCCREFVITKVLF